MLTFLMLLACAGTDEAGDPGGLPGLGSDTSGSEVDVPPTSGEPVPRVVLHEAFSGSNCGPCAPAAENLSAALADKSGMYAMLKYQIGSDPYISPEAVSRRMFYLPGADTYSIPWVVADGVHEFHPNEMDHGGAYLAEDFDTLAAHQAFLQVDVEMEVTDQTVDITVDLYPTIDITGEDLRLFIAIKEITTQNNVGSNGQTEFHDVLKKFVPDNNGTPINTLVAGEQSTHTAQYVFQGEYDAETGISNPVDHSTAHTVEGFDDLAVVVWVQDLSTWEVFNAGMAGGH